MGWLALVPLSLGPASAPRAREPLLLFHAAPAVVMLGLDALIGNHYTRYNLSF